MKKRVCLVFLFLAFALSLTAQTHVTQTECATLYNGSGGSGSGGRANNVDFENCITSAAGWSDNVNAQTGTTYTVVEEDAARLTTFSNASAIAVTLPQAGTTGFEDGAWFILRNINTGVVTVTPTTSTVDGNATLVITEDEWAIIWSDGSNYFTTASAAVYDLIQIQLNNIGTTSTTAVELVNDTSATEDNPQNSPALLFKGSVFDDHENASETEQWRIEVAPRQWSDGMSLGNDFERPLGFRVMFQEEAAGAWHPFILMHNHMEALDADAPFPNFCIGLKCFADYTNFTSTALGNMGIGNTSLQNLTSGSENTAIASFGALDQCTSCDWNTAIGNEALHYNVSGDQNVAIGQDAGRHSTEYNAVRTSNQNTYIGVGAAPVSPRQNNGQVAIGFQAYAEDSGDIVIGNNTTEMSAGGWPAPDRTLTVADHSDLEAESLNETDFSTHVNWDSSGDFDDTGGDCDYNHSVGWGYCTQQEGNMAIAGVGNALYVFQYEITARGGDPQCDFENGFAAGSGYELKHVNYRHGVYTGVGTWQGYLRTTASPGNFAIHCTSDSVDDVISFDNVSLKRVNGGNIYTAGDIVAGDRISWYDFTEFPGNFLHANTASRDWTFPDASGNVILDSATQTLTGKTIDPEATGNVITQIVEPQLPLVGCAGATASQIWDTLATEVPTFTCSAGSTNTTMMRGSVDFPDSDGDYSIQTVRRIPWGWSGNIDLYGYWRTTVTTGDVVWQVMTACRDDAEVDDVAWNTAQVVIDTAKATANQLNDFSLADVTMTGCTAGDLLHLRILRNRTHASDSLAAVPSLTGTISLVIRKVL